MEKNNGRKSVSIEKPTVKKMSEENEQLKNVLQQVVNENQQLRNTWALNRATFLFKILELECFDKEVKTKASEELVAFLFPKKEEINVEDK